MEPSSKILIVGSGVFGISTAYHLLKRGFKDVTVIDKSPVLPTPGAASHDINKVVRSSYSDTFYSKLAHNAIRLWRDKEEWGNTYHESGVLVLGAKLEGEGETPYADASYANDIALGVALRPLKNGEEIRRVFPAGVKTAFFDRSSGFLNPEGGWANATQGVSKMMDKVVSLGGTIIPNKGANKLLRQHGKTEGVVCSDGTTYHADLIVLATGSWTASAFPELDLDSTCLATGQCIATIQLTEEEASLYKDVPVVLDFGSGFYIFPPNEQHIIKCAFHAPGLTHYLDHSSAHRQISTPRTVLSHDQEGLRIPKTAAKALRDHLREVYPDLAKKPFAGTRLCWYTDSPDSDWVIGFYPDDSGLVLATSGSGHAYKFLPNIGGLIADIIQGTSDPLLTHKFAINRVRKREDLSRSGGQVQELDLTSLCTTEDLAP